MITIREASLDDSGAIWEIIEPVIRAGETLCLARDMGREALLGYWFQEQHAVFVAELDEEVVGTYFLRPNQPAQGSHVANCGYVTSPKSAGKGIARAMCAHSLAFAKEKGDRSMQFNIVVSSNEPAVHLWKSMGFEVIGTVPGGFLHPTHGYVDTYVMFREL